MQSQIESQIFCRNWQIDSKMYMEIESTQTIQTVLRNLEDLPLQDFQVVAPQCGHGGAGTDTGLANGPMQSDSTEMGPKCAVICFFNERSKLTQ